MYVASRMSLPHYNDADDEANADALVTWNSSTSQTAPESETINDFHSTSFSIVVQPLLPPPHPAQMFVVTQLYPQRRLTTNNSSDESQSLPAELYGVQKRVKDVPTASQLFDDNDDVQSGLPHASKSNVHCTS